MVMPSISGSPRSSTTRSGQCELIMEKASLPEWAMITSYPLDTSIARIKPEMLFSSSTTSILSLMFIFLSFQGQRK